jgi:serine/threonine protein kinase
MADYHFEQGQMILDKVQLTDLDNAAHLPNGRYIKNTTVGNENWRSPEAFFRGKITKQTDIFSFGIVVRASTPLPAPETNAPVYLRRP